MADGIESFVPEEKHTQGFVFVVLFLVVLPIVVILSQVAPYVLLASIGAMFVAWFLHAVGALGDSEDEASLDAADPMTTLQERYARGEIDDAEFERRLDRLVEVEELDLDEASGADRERLLEPER